MQLLLVEDDLDLGRSLTESLRAAGFDVEWVRRAAEAEQFVQRGGQDAVVLDLSLPDGHGLELLRRWRTAKVNVALLVITASTELGDRLQGLDEGADDFLVKPFAVQELVSRLHAVARRSARQAAAEWRFGDLVITPQRRLCRLGEETLALTPREFDILLVLARAGGEVVPKHRLAQALQPLGDAVDFAAIEVHVHHLRRKIGGARVRTVRGVGYALSENGPASS